MTEMILIEKNVLLADIERLVDKAVRSKNESEWLTKQELAKYLKVSLTTIDEWRKNKGFPVRWAGDKPRFHKSEVDDWVRANLPQNKG